MLHGTGIFTYIWLKFMVIARKYSSPMEHLGLVFFQPPKLNPVLVSFTKNIAIRSCFFGVPRCPPAPSSGPGYLEFGLPPRGAPLRRFVTPADFVLFKEWPKFQ